MTFDYNALYGTTPNALGEPTVYFVDFFARFDRQHARVLDVGCGQGRDALFIARRGHTVVGVDISSNGIRDLEATAEGEGLSIKGVVADVADYTPEGRFDVILIDRTLHMLPRSTRLTVLATLLEHVVENGWLLIADEPSNIGDFERVIADHGARWNLEFRHRGYLFAHRS